jgi:hypothetical protein
MHAFMIVSPGTLARGRGPLPKQAQERAPSIVFMDELDGLVPARSARGGSGDQIYASVVSTLLALMDGVQDRGNVIIVAATNRHVVPTPLFFFLFLPSSFFSSAPYSFSCTSCT